MWILFALSASFFWGLTYVFSEQVYKKISIFTALSIGSLVIFIVTFFISYFSGNLKLDIQSISSSKQLFWYLIGGILVLLIAEIFIGFSITAKNATLAGLIEISYPIFIILFSYLLYKTKISWQTAVGGLVVFIGIFIIYYFNR